MATFRKRGSRWQAIIRRSGMPPLSKTFATKSDASRWARQTEQEADIGYLREDVRVLAKITLRELLVRYRDEITPRKRGGDVETVVLNALVRRSICTYSLDQLAPKHLAEYRDKRREEVGPATVNKDLALIQHAIKIGQQEWGIPIIQNPVTRIRKLVRPQGRERRLQGSEFDILIAAAKKCRSKYMEPVIRLAVETGMRRNELLKLTWAHLNLATRTAHLPLTKNGFSRTIPLTPEAIRVLDELPRNDPRVIPLSSEAAKLSWQRLAKRAGMVDLHFHDLRHEATSRFFELGLSVPEVALITGHRDGRMLFRYTHLRPEAVALKLSQLTSSINLQAHLQKPPDLPFA